MLNCNKLLVTAFLAVVSLTVSAQRPAYYKMSTMVREACLTASQAKAKGMLPSKTVGQQMMTAFVKLTDDDTSAITGNGGKVLARYGSLCVAEIPLSSVGPLSMDSHVLRIEANRTASALMDTTAIIVDAVPAWEGTGLPQGYTGKGVVVGVQDIGFDLTHPTFWSADMSRYRIKAMWDQLSYDTLASTLPVGRDYVGQEQLLAVGCPRDGKDQTHGTHTTGIAAGSGAEGDGVQSAYKGIAPDADICLVCNATSNDAALIDPKDYYRYTYAMDALGFKYIFDYADSQGMPCVINFSEGSRMDFRGDDQLYYEMLDSLTGPGHIIVASAGNNGAAVTYVLKDSSEPSTSIYCSRGTRYAMATTKSRDDFTFRVTLTKDNTTLTKDIPLSSVLATADSTLTDTISGNGIACPITAGAYRSCFDDDDLICDWLIMRDTVNSANDHGWIMKLTLIGDGTVEMFPSSGSFYHDGYSFSDGDNAYSVNSPGSAPSVICVGMTGYRTQITNHNGKVLHPSGGDVAGGQRNGFSSVGPTFDGRTKPDVMAPGQNVISSYSSFYIENHPTATDVATYDVRHFTYNGRTYAWNSNSGTSMAAPVVTGIIALWLQANPRLTPDDCIDIFSKTCTHYDESLSYPNNYYGYGQIDAAEGLKLAVKKAANGIIEIKRNSVESQRIYSANGMFVGTDLSRLPHGVYITGGKKIVK